MHVSHCLVGRRFRAAGAKGSMARTDVEDASRKLCAHLGEKVDGHSRTIESRHSDLRRL